MRTNICVIGSSNTDLILRVPQIPRPGETVLGGQFTTAQGGKGANQAVAAARAGASVQFIARVGADAFGRQALESLKDEGVDVTGVGSDTTQPTGVAFIFVSEHGENSIGVASGANGALCPDQITRCADAIGNSNMVLLQLESPLETVQRAVGMAYAAGVPVILNPAPARTLSDELLSKLTVITPNESETELLTGIAITGETSAHKAANQLLERGARNVVITLGRKGAFLANAADAKRVQAFDAGPAIDTTAAGDVFNGMLAVALSEGMPLEAAVEISNAAAAISVTRLGAQPSAPMRGEIEALLRSGKRLRA